MFLLILLALEATVMLEAYLAWKDGYLFMSQVQRLPHQVGMKVSAFIEHAGMWGDFFIVSPLVAFIIAEHHQNWSNGQIMIALFVGLILAIVALIIWSKSSVSLDGEFARDGKPTLPGWIHFIYTVVALTSLVLFYTTTLPQVVNILEASIITFGMMIHIVLGVILPDLNTNGRVSAISYSTVGVVWFFLLVGQHRLIW